MVFLSPILLTGLALASVPVIIHLLNRRRFRVVEWAPMKYLRLTIKTNRRRMRIEQFVLLAVRTLAVVALVLAVARPVLSATGLGSWLGSRGRAVRVVVIDDSLSMGYQSQPGRSAFDLAKDAATQLVKNVGPQDSLTLLTTCAPDAPVLRDAHLDDPAKATAAVAALRTTDARGDWPGVFKVIDRHLAAGPFPTKDVVIVTDLRREGWGVGVTEVANRWAAQGVDVKVIDVGARRTTNLTLAAFEQQDPVALPGAPVNLMATIRNDEPTPLAASHAVLTVDGESRPISLPDLAPGSTTQVPLSVTVQEPGQHPLRLTLPGGDALPADDVRWLNLDVRPNLQITLVDGEPGARPFEGETDFLALSFSVGSVPWRVTRQADTEWLATGLGGAAGDVIVLANVSSLPPERAAALERLVREDGVGLMVFAGEQLDPQLYNDRLYADGKGLLPAKLVKASEEPVTGMVVESLAGSPLAALGKIDPAALARVVAKRFMIAEANGGTGNQPVSSNEREHGPAARATTDDVRVLARWNDPEGRPAVIEKRVGRGRVLLWTVTADRQWSDWPVDPTYVLAVRSAALAVARPDGKTGDVEAGEPIRHVAAETNDPITDPRVTPPDASDPVVAGVETTAGGVAVAYPLTARAGVYGLKWKDNAGTDRSHTVVSNPNKAESDLRPLTEPELADLMGGLDAPVIPYGGDASLTGPGREIWKTLATALLCFLAVETVLAVWVGRER